jgi:hypothetical protein
MHELLEALRRANGAEPEAVEPDGDLFADAEPAAVPADELPSGTE